MTESLKNHPAPPLLLSGSNVNLSKLTEQNRLGFNYFISHRLVKGRGRSSAHVLLFFHRSAGYCVYCTRVKKSQKPFRGVALVITGWCDACRTYLSRTVIDDMNERLESAPDRKVSFSWTGRFSRLKRLRPFQSY